MSLAGTPNALVTGAWIDVARTRTLVDDVFVQHTGVPDRWGHWPDASTTGIPRMYAWTYLALAQEALLRGDKAGSARYQSRMEAWADLGS